MLAREIGVDRGVIGRILRQQQLPTHEQAIWLAKALAVPVEQLFPAGSFRGSALEQQRQAQVAERVLNLERTNAELALSNELLAAQREELVAAFAAKLLEEQQRNAGLNEVIAEQARTIAALEMELRVVEARLWAEQLAGAQTRRLLEHQNQELRTQVERANARAATSAATGQATEGSLATLGVARLDAVRARSTDQ